MQLGIGTGVKAIGALKTLQSYNPKRRGAKTRGTANAKKAPALKTLLMEQSALNQIFYDAFERGRMQQVFKMRVAERDRTPNRRAGFDTAREYLVLVRNLRSYRDCVGRFKSDGLNAWHKLHRTQLSYFIMFLLHSGLRVGEAREMRWSDVKLDEEVEGEEERIAEVRVSKATKKGQARFVQTQPGANNALKEWRKVSPHTAANDWVWFGQQHDAKVVASSEGLAAVRTGASLDQAYLLTTGINEDFDLLCNQIQRSLREAVSFAGDVDFSDTQEELARSIFKQARNLSRLMSEEAISD